MICWLSHQIEGMIKRLEKKTQMSKLMNLIYVDLSSVYILPIYMYFGFGFGFGFFVT